MKFYHAVSPITNKTLQTNCTVVFNLSDLELSSYIATNRSMSAVYSYILQATLAVTLSARVFKIVHGLFHFPSGIFNTQAELQVLTDPFCFINPSPALTTSITHLSLVQSLYGTHYHCHLYLIVTYHILDHMYGCILHISSAILCILCYSA